MTEPSLDQLMPATDEPVPTGFDVVMRGYDRRQVDDYLDRLEAAHAEAVAVRDAHAQRVTALESELADLQHAFAEAKARAEQAAPTRVELGERLTRMLGLAEEEAAEIRRGAMAEAERAVAAAKSEAGELQESNRRQDEEATRVREQAAGRLEADLEQRRQASREALEQEQRDAQIEAHRIRTESREEADRLRAEAERQVATLAAQRDRIGDELQRLRDHLASVTGVLSGGAVDLRGADGEPADSEPAAT